MAKILFVINPVSGGLQKSELIDLIRSHDKDVEILLTTGKNDPRKLRNQLDTHAYDRVVVAGGDGTIAMAAVEMIGRDLPMGIIPVGSANGLAHELSLPMETEKALKKALNGTGKPFDIIEINNKWHMIHMADFGMNATLVKRYQNDKHRGLIGYAISGFKEIANLMNIADFDLEVGGNLRTIESTFVIIANARRYGTGIEVNPTGKVDDGKFEICCLQSITFEDFLQRFVEKREFELNPFEILSTDQAMIRLKKETDFQIDGEYKGKVQDLAIKILKGAVRLVF